MPAAHFTLIGFVTFLARTTSFFAVRSVIIVGVGFAIIRFANFAKTRRIYKLNYGKNQLATEAKTMAKIIPYYSFLISIATYFEFIHFVPFTWLGSVQTFVASFIWNEIWFYGLHRALHHPKLMFIHRDHHRSPVASPLSTASFSFTEQTFQVVAALFWPAVSSHFLPWTFEGITLYSIFTVVVNLLGHMNVEVYPPWFAASKFGKWFSTPTYHSLHHGRVRGHYGLLSTIPDRLFGTYFEDYPRVQRRASEGNGLTRAAERVPAFEAAVSAPPKRKEELFPAPPKRKEELFPAPLPPMMAAPLILNRNLIYRVPDESVRAQYEVF